MWGTGCTITDCEVGIEILEGVRADLRHNNISFCGCGIVMDGIGRISDNVMWGNGCHMQGAALEGSEQVSLNVERCL